MPPKVSVLMPNYNCEKYLSEAIESILSQSFTDFEFIIIDDCSTDNSWEIIQEFAQKDSRIIPLKNEKNMHIVYSRNRALSRSSGIYIAFLDSDDIAKKNRLKKQIELLEKLESKSIGICGTNFDLIDKDNKLIGEKTFPETDTDCRNSIWYKNPFGSLSGMIIRLECFEKIGNFRNDYKNAEDLDIIIRIGSQYKLYNLQEKLTIYRIHGENSILKQQKQMIQSTLKARRNAIKLGYKIDLKGRLFYFGTWCMQFMPSKFVLWLFKKVT